MVVKEKNRKRKRKGSSRSNINGKKEIISHIVKLS